jgi:hypothetical protein
MQKVFDYEKWIDLLVKWIIVSDAAFTEVERPEFIDLLQYTYNGVDSLHVPSSGSIKNRTLQLFEKTTLDLNRLFAVSRCSDNDKPGTHSLILSGA